MTLLMGNNKKNKAPQQAKYEKELVQKQIKKDRGLMFAARVLHGRRSFFGDALAFALKLCYNKDEKT